MEIPPKAVKNQVMRLDPMGSPALRRGKPSLPVLEAFQEFLEAERRRAHRRMLAMAAFGLILFILLGAGGFFAGTVLFRQVAGDVRDVRTDLASVRGASRKIEAQTQLKLKEFSSRTGELQATLDAERRALVSVREELGSRLGQTDEDIDGMHTVIDTLRDENRRLRRELARVQDILPMLTADLETVRRVVKDGPVALRKEESEEPAGPIPTMVSMSITPSGAERPVAWRLPIPE
jgi:hypothetical protein